MRQQLKRLIIVFLLVSVLLMGPIAYFYFAFQDLMVTHYILKINVDCPLRIVHLSDLHNKEFGEINEKLISLVAEQNPDLVFMSGDMLNRDELNTEIVFDLIKALTLIAPVYFGFGNHEVTWEQNYGENLRQIFTDAGAVVVNNEYVDVEIKGQQLRIGGYMGYYRQPGMFPVTDEQRVFELAFADAFENTDCLKLLINHVPTAWLDWDYIDKYPVDVVFCGHYHGGTVRIPIIDQGLYAPYIGWFPPYTKGIYQGEKATCVLSAGLGNEHHFPRINNRPEITVVDLVPKE